MTTGWMRTAWLVLLLAVGLDEGVAAASRDPHVERLRTVMRAHHADSLVHAEAVRDSYGAETTRLLLADRDALRDGLASGDLWPIPVDASVFNVAARLHGPHQIAELDPAHQPLYLSARPEVVGLLLDLGSRLPRGHLDVTSLVRHAAYQRSLAARNPNARTSVPTHAMGLAVDISVLHMTARQARALGHVLRDMAAHGALHYAAEQRQLVFHVVPAAARRAYYREFAQSVLGASSLHRLRPWPALLSAPAPLPTWQTVPPVMPPLAWDHGRLVGMLPEGDWYDRSTPAGLSSGYTLPGAAALVTGSAVWGWRRRLRQRVAGWRVVRNAIGFVLIPLGMIVAPVASLRARPASAPLVLPPVPAVDPYAAYVDRTPVHISFMAGPERLVERVTADELRRSPAVWRRMSLADWNGVPDALRRSALDAMVERYASLLVAPAMWSAMGPADWDRVPQPIRTAAYRQMVRYWTAHYRVGAAWNLPEPVVADTLAAIVMSESWFDHRGLLVNTDGSTDIGLGGASAYARARLRQLHAREVVDVSFDDGAYLNPWNATRFVAVWMTLLLDEADGDLDLAVRAYNRGMARARDRRGTAYLAAVRRRHDRFIVNGDAPPAWRYLWERTAALEARSWAAGPIGHHAE